VQIAGAHPREGRRVRWRSFAALAAAAAVSAALAGCTKRAERDAARATIERYRRESGAKPLGAAHLVRLRLRPPPGAPPEASGRGEIAWEQDKYRESLSSQGLFTVRGIQSAKAYFTDEDGVTRVVSEPILKELTTRAYFWRRSWLFESLGGARISPGADGRSVVLEIRGGNPLTLVFTGDGRRLEEARSPRMRLLFTAAESYRDLSDPARPLEVDIEWIGLPTALLPDATVGGGSARFSASPGARYAAEGGRVLLESTIGELPVRLRLEADGDRLLRVSPRLAERLDLTFRQDASGRWVTRGAALAAGGVRFADLAVARDERLTGEEAEAGAPFFRETVVEIDPAAGMMRFHDPETWAPPENLVRVLIDDDGDRPAAIFTRGGETLRLLFPTAIEPELLLAPMAADRVGLGSSGQADGLRWGALRMPPMLFARAADRFDPEWGNHGALGWPVLLRQRTYIHMPRRWLYLDARL
jgi:hypothetical protein